MNQGEQVDKPIRTRVHSFTAIALLSVLTSISCLHENTDIQALSVRFLGNDFDKDIKPISAYWARRPVPEAKWLGYLEMTIPDKTWQKTIKNYNLKPAQIIDSTLIKWPKNLRAVKFQDAQIYQGHLVWIRESGSTRVVAIFPDHFPRTNVVPITNGLLEMPNPSLNSDPTGTAHVYVSPPRIPVSAHHPAAGRAGYLHSLGR